MFENLNLFTAIVLYLLIWWVVIFCVLPLKIQSSRDAKKTGNMPGAPEHPHLKYKFILTTIITTVVWGIVVLIIRYGDISFSDMADKMPR
jgi:predicted secreted protein